jgi:predicted O-methyltransferase YrrM
LSYEKWTDVERYITETLVRPDAALDAALESSAAAGLPQISITPPQGKLLSILARSIKASSILEIGTLGGYSTIWLARSLPEGGRLISLEVNARHAEVAKANIARAGLSRVVDVRLGPALETLPKLQAEGVGPFDFFFIDADKPNNAEYFQWAVNLSHPGSLIVVDNVIREGEVVDSRSRDPSIIGTRRLNEAVAKEKRVSATEIQTVDSKGYDGFAVAIVLED